MIVPPDELPSIDFYDYGDYLKYIFTKTYTNPEVRQIYQDRVFKHFFNNGTFTAQALNASYLALKQPIEPWIRNITSMFTLVRSTYFQFRRNDGGRYNGAVPRTSHSSLPRFVARALCHADSLQEQMKAVGLWQDSVLAPVFSVYGGTVPTGTSISLSNPNNDSQIFYTIDGIDPRGVGGVIQVCSCKIILLLKVSRA
jgi:hypothetical protein